MVRRKRQQETNTTSDVISVLEARGYHVYKVYNGGIPARCQRGMVVYKKKEDKDMGIPDLIAINQETKDFMFIEMKSEKGKLSKFQKEFIESFNECETFSAIMCRSGEDIIKIIRESI